MIQQERRNNKSVSMSQFKKKLSESAGNVEALLELGKSCFLSERYSQAIEAYKKALSVKNRNETVHYNLGVAYQAKGEYRKAKDAFLKALEIDPNHKAAQEALNSLTDY
jgi:tetratricopeptide (TPR) repeat protein